MRKHFRGVRKKKNAEYLHTNKETRGQGWMVQTLRWTGASGLRRQECFRMLRW